MRPSFITIILVTFATLLSFATLGSTTASADQVVDLDTGSLTASKPSGAMLNLELSFLGIGGGGTAPLYGSNVSFRAHRYLDFRLGLHMLAIWPVADVGASVFFTRGAVAPYATARISHLGIGAVGAGVELGSGSTVFTLEADVLTVASDDPLIMTSLGIGFRL